jgi:O-antigen/teichoic acid export membrane protein
LRRRFIENLLFFAALNLLIKPLYVFGIDRVVQNSVGTTIYGTYFALFNLVLIFQIFLDLGIDNFTRREVAHNPGLASRFLASFLALKLLLIIIFIAVFSMVGFLIPHNKEEWQLLVILVVNQSLASLILYIRAHLGGLHMFKAEGVTSVLDRLIMILICGTLLIIPLTKHVFRIHWFVLAQTVAYFITLLFSLSVVLRKTEKLSLKVNIIRYIPILQQLKPYAILALLMAFYYRIDSVFLRFLLPDGKEQAGIYAHGFRILDFMSNYALIFSLILLPTFARMISKKESVVPLLTMATLLLVVPSISLLTGIAVFREEVFQILYPGSDMNSANVFLILTLSFAGVCVSYTFGALLTANGNLKELIIMAIGAVIISTALNLIFVPRYKVIGSALANSGAQLFTIIYHLYVSSKKLNLRLNLIIALKLFVFIVFSVGIALIIQKWSPLSWLISLVMVVSISLSFALLIKLFKLSEINQLLKGYQSSKELSTTPE